MRSDMKLSGAGRKRSRPGQESEWNEAEGRALSVRAALAHSGSSRPGAVRAPGMPPPALHIALRSSSVKTNPKKMKKGA